MITIYMWHLKQDTNQLMNKMEADSQAQKRELVTKGEGEREGTVR